ncbi:uncharacterized protein LOC133286625 [Gastrolobium bilobum]|uniref:uncharacterized protein LOC133286625 n=1 Tax=Gastrolobium bilobum TaxID=150636 RepID=UPI002AB28A9B|nr:uncharacterized protein LOC133286625 [Gastrolobium bilobum]
MALLLYLRSITKTNIVSNPSLRHHLFSISNSNGGGGDQAPPSSNSPFSSYFRDVKDMLKQHSPSPSTPKISNPRSPSFSFHASSKSERTNSSSATALSCLPLEIHKRNLAQNQGESAGNAINVKHTKPSEGEVSFDAISESLQQIRVGGDNKGADRMSTTGWKDTWKLKPSDSMIIGGTDLLPYSIFSMEMRERREGDGFSAVMKMEFMKMYNHGELGDKLRKLRSEGKGK